MGICCVNASFTHSHRACRAVPDSPLDAVMHATGADDHRGGGGDGAAQAGTPDSSGSGGEGTRAQQAGEAVQQGVAEEAQTANGEGDVAGQGELLTWASHGMLALQETLLAAAALFQLMFLLGGPVSRCATLRDHMDNVLAALASMFAESASLLELSQQLRALQWH